MALTTIPLCLSSLACVRGEAMCGYSIDQVVASADTTGFEHAVSAPDFLQAQATARPVATRLATPDAKLACPQLQSCISPAVRRRVVDSVAFTYALSQLPPDLSEPKAAELQTINFDRKYPVFGDGPNQRSAPSVRTVMIACCKKGYLFKIHPEMLMVRDELTEEDVGEILSRVFAVIEALPDAMSHDPHNLITIQVGGKTDKNTQQTIFINAQKPMDAGENLLREVVRFKFIEKGQDCMSAIRKALTSFLQDIYPDITINPASENLLSDQLILDLVLEIAVTGKVCHSELLHSLDLYICDVSQLPILEATKKFNITVRNIIQKVLFSHTTAQGEQTIQWPRIKDRRLIISRPTSDTEVLTYNLFAWTNNDEPD